jgi:hypothetical protein
MVREDEIKLIAYRIWEEEGCCQGRDIDHWVRAELIWEQQQNPNKEAQTGLKPKKLTPKTSRRRTSTRKKSQK